MNKAQAIAAAKDAGLAVTPMKTGEATHKCSDCNKPRWFMVGNRRVHHDAIGGAACWSVDGKRVGFVAEAIMRAVETQAA